MFKENSYTKQLICKLATQINTTYQPTLKREFNIIWSTSSISVMYWLSK